VSRGEKASATTNSGGADWVREVRAEDEAGAVSGGDGAGGAVGRVTGVGGTARENGRPPVGLSIMLRVYFLQQ
jgi:hypothetical protein